MADIENGIYFITHRKWDQWFLLEVEDLMGEAFLEMGKDSLQGVMEGSRSLGILKLYQDLLRDAAPSYKGLASRPIFYSIIRLN